MSKLTPFGRFIRKYRIDHDILLKHMADKLGLSSAFLSAIENGAKSIPFDFEDKLIKIYPFTIDEINQLK